MVRAHLKQSPSEEKKETTKKKTPAKRRTAVTGVWPCKINGCNKQFAREADLKRHQRTTKLHSMPGFACPQCDATFTRTDALRRHQKSRHNGVVIEPNGEEMARDDDQPEDQSQVAGGSQSRSASPGGKGKEKPSVLPDPTALAQPGTPGPGGGYYRQHTAANGAFIPPPQRHTPPAMMDTQYTQPSVALPTSATRLHQASWGAPGPWNSDGPPPSHIGPVSYHSGVPGHPYFQPPPPGYYRPLVPPQQQQLANGPDQSHPGKSQDGHGSKADIEMAVTEATPTAPVIDPSLDDPKPTSVSTDTNAQLLSLQITQAAVEAVLESARQAQEAAGVAAAIVSAARAASNASEAATPKGQVANVEAEDGDIDADGEGDVEGDEGRATDELPASTSAAANEGSAEAESANAENGQSNLITQEIIALLTKPPPQASS